MLVATLQKENANGTLRYYHKISNDSKTITPVITFYLKYADSMIF